MPVTLTKLKSGPKKFQAIFYDKNRKKVKTIRFGARGYEDFLSHKDPERMKRYVDRHRKREDWTRSGKYSPGFWSRWLLWSEPSFTNALKLTEKKLGEKITYSRT
ncbi:hypothetical protein FK949_gp059 [Paramecium bursaria Chlorella virus NYs1]|uniref:Uncharacterized protein n=1 Tax=Paramecium bursaria Chlorella virus NYs1 TaxID=83442 RepID=M1I800_9PHYC|nr:hypothetical protein AR158_C160R [Paramecium bursaria Chlorella virus AR158]YP_009665269.1 hypothetical protein FK949_gp059 [Paramecium bursaria Chlorella virus NYs1]ABU43706.1 hypothetical protein AR158_C160R [Paramecium bursaria Chlorella virus AR158]AGE54102.1 hypothetical protein PBCVIL52s1_101L [Paramecium bursaria Chlorella virus IL-5-2s1]AGE58624.1 hypothetical protein PBCVNYs1_173R [Paramecium bursaria Chlorella virus NYs1]